MRRLHTLVLALLALSLPARSDDGYRLWLHYDRIEDATYSSTASRALAQITFATPTGTESPTITAARNELTTALTGLLGLTPTISLQQLPASPTSSASSTSTPHALSSDAFSLSSPSSFTPHSSPFTISSSSDTGILYGAFALLRLIQTRQPLDNLSVTSSPKIQHRLLNHWDDLNGHVERGYAGFSLWEWFYLPEIRNPRYRDYARACASLGLNGTVLTNVNANAQILTTPYLAKVAALAAEFRPYGVRVYLTARFSAPIEIGGLTTADPLDPAVAAWWKNKVTEIYRAIPDFGGFLVKANSEGQPGPQDYKRTHADGANLLADAVAPHGGIIMWRAFVYSPDNNDDRVKQAVTEFAPLDGKFRDNVIVQIKNGPLDFMPREPFSPLFGAMPKTRLAAELQITQEYLGQSTQLAFLAPMWREFLDADTFANGPGTTIASIVDGRAKAQQPSVIAGVANTGTDRNWTGHLLAQANWYAFGRLAWDHSLSSEQIADEWTKMTFGHEVSVVSTITKLLLGSRETVVNYSMPLGLTHIMAEGHHYGPGPWVDKLGRADWTSVYYHRADETGLGFNRTATGSNALAQYAAPVSARFASLADCPENLLLWFHHVPWDHKMKSGRTLWDELCLRYQQGVDEVRTLRRDWDSLKGRLDDERFTHVQQRLTRQELDAVEWRDACLLYFQTFSKRPFPADIDKPGHPLSHYIALKRHHMPGDPSGR